MATVIRLLVYEGSEDVLDRQLGRSMPDGVREIQAGNPKSVTIRVITLPSAFLRLLKELGTDLTKQGLVEEGSGYQTHTQQEPLSVEDRVKVASYLRTTEEKR